MICKLCNREILEKDKSKHHLIPKSQGGENEDTVILHCICHNQIHALYNEKILAAHFNTMTSLINDWHLRRFIKWLKNKPLSFDSKARRLSTRR